jgi:hypothetical protein
MFSGDWRGSTLRKAGCPFQNHYELTVHVYVQAVWPDLVGDWFECCDIVFGRHFAYVGNYDAGPNDRAVWATYRLRPLE